MDQRSSTSHVRRCAALALVAFSIAFAGSVAAEVKLPNGEYTEQVEDLRVQIVGGPLRATRTWLALNINKGEYRWYLNPAWADLDFELDSLDGSVKTVSRAGSKFERSGNGIYVFDSVYFVARQTNAGGATTGWRWYDRRGNWITYAADGKILAYGDRNDVTVHFARDANGRLARVDDHHGATALTIAYHGESTRVASVTDRTGRRVQYEYASNGDLTQVVDVLGRRWTYGYAGGLLTSKSGPTCQPDPTCGEAEPPRTTTISYSGNRVVGIVDPLQHATTWDYAFDRGKRQYTVVEKSAEGVRVERRYDADGRRVRETIGTRVVYTLRRDGRYVDITTDERGLTTRTEYDANRNVVKTTHPDGTSTSAKYHSQYNVPLERVDELGVKTRFDYDDNGNVDTLTEAVGTPAERVTTYTYDDVGQVEARTVVAATAAGDATTRWTYDAYGNEETQTDAEDRVTVNTHDVVGNVLTRKDPREKTWTSVYDARGRLVSFKDPLDHEQSIRYDKFGAVAKEIDALGKETVYSYYASGKVKTVTSPAGGVTTYVYDKDGRTTSVADPNGVATTYGYDGDGRRLSSTDAAGNAVTTVYGEGANAGLVVRLRFPMYCEDYRYDQRGRRTQAIRRLPCDEPQSTEITSVGYDANGRTISETDALQHTTLHAYDALGRLTETTDALAGKVVYGYDKLDARTIFKDANGNTHRFVFDRGGNLLSETRPLGGTSAFAYDAAGNLITRTNADGARRVYAYDDAGRRIGEKRYEAGSNTPSQTIVFEYDVRNLMTAYAQSGDTATAATYTYDDDRRKLGETVTYGAGAQVFTRTIASTYWPNGLPKTFAYPDQTTIAYTYDGNNRIETAGLPGGGEIRWSEYQGSRAKRVTMPGVVRATLFDPLQRPVSIVSQTIGAGTAQAPAGPVVLSQQYRYDAEGDIVERTADEGVYAYEYDALGRVTAATPPVGVQGTPPNGLPIERYTYDAGDNRASSEHQPGPWSYNVDNQLLAYGAGVDEHRYEYTASGHVARETAGLPASPSRDTHYRYDADERLREVETGGQTVGRYDYDPFGRRIRKETQQGVVWFQYSDDGLVAEYAQNGAPTRIYGWTPGAAWGIEPLWLADRSGGAWQLGFYHNDHIGTPRRVTDAGGAVVWSALLDAYGRANVASSSTVGNPLRFPGQYFDAETSYHYNYYRDYNPATGRYLQSDPAGLYGDDNLYAYVNARPLTLVDPYGLFGGCYSLEFIKVFDGATIKIISAVGDCPKMETLESYAKKPKKVEGKILNKECKTGKCVNAEDVKEARDIDATDSVTFWRGDWLWQITTEESDAKKNGYARKCTVTFHMKGKVHLDGWIGECKEPLACL